MGTQRVEAFLQCRHLTAMETSDYALMIVICHRWNDGQVRDFDIRFPVLLDLMPYRNGARPERMLRTSIDRLVKSGLLRVEHNGARYLRDRWMHVAIADEKFHGNLEAIKDRARERRAGERPCRSPTADPRNLPPPRRSPSVDRPAGGGPGVSGRR